jgi:hypothetical protein
MGHESAFSRLERLARNFQFRVGRQRSLNLELLIGVAADLKFLGMLVGLFIRTSTVNTKIDIKSALLGLILGVVVTVGTTRTASRYQIVSVANQGMVLDTVTGEVWSQPSSWSGKPNRDSFYEPKR